MHRSDGEASNAHVDAALRTLKRRPDTPKLAHATVRAVVAEASRLVPELTLFAGGKSFGGRMTSQAQAAAPLARVRGLVSSAFRCIRRENQAPSEGRTCSTCIFRRCSFRGRATSSPS